MEIADYLRFIAALVFILGLIGACAWGARRFGLAEKLQGGGTTAGRRLAVVETMTIDMKRKLIMIRRDGCEHLIMVGGERDLLIESGIVAPETSAARDLETVPRIPRIGDFMKERLT